MVQSNALRASHGVQGALNGVSGKSPTAPGLSSGGGRLWEGRATGGNGCARGIAVVAALALHQAARFVGSVKSTALSAAKPGACCPVLRRRI